MKNFNSAWVLGCVCASFSFATLSAVAAPPTAQDQADFTQINSACTQDAQTASCGNEVVGKGLLKCLHAYKKAQRQTNKSFEFSSGCESALKQLRSDRRAGK